VLQVDIERALDEAIAREDIPPRSYLPNCVALDFAGAHGRRAVTPTRRSVRPTWAPVSPLA